MAELQNPILLLAIIQDQDVEAAMKEFEQAGIFCDQLPSIGAFLGRKNASLLIATPASKLTAVLEIIRRTCKQRTEYIASPIETGSIPMPLPIPITVGGATIFFMQLDHFEEL